MLMLDFFCGKIYGKIFRVLFSKLEIKLLFFENKIVLFYFIDGYGS